MIKHRLVIHIGIHKTGSTSIQKTLLNNQTSLRRSNYSIYSYNKDGICNGEGNVNSWFSFSGEKESFKAKVDYEIISRIRNVNTNVIISSEHFSWLSRQELIKFIGACNQYFKVDVIYVLRRQDKHVVSNYRQGFKIIDSTSAMFFGRKLYHMPSYDSYHDEYYDYYGKCKSIENIIGKESLKLIEYRSGTDITPGFFCAIGLPISVGNNENENLNQSFGCEQMIIADLFFNKLKINLHLGFLVNFKSKSKVRLDNRKMGKYLDKFYMSNVMLKEDYGIDFIENISIEDYVFDECCFSYKNRFVAYVRFLFFIFSPGLIYKVIKNIIK